MEIKSPKLFIEISNLEYIFMVGDENEKGNFKFIYKDNIPIQGIKNFRIADFDLVHSTIKKNIYLIEQKYKCTFKDTVIILNNFYCSFINLTGFQKLNGSQILKENIIYIINSLKSNVDEVEKDKDILHIFNSQYQLDKKEIENLPIGLFGDFYSHELSFCLIKKNDYKNLKNIFDKCNLKLKRILLKSFVEGSYASCLDPNIDTFFQIEINEISSRIFYFQNNSLKFEQSFDFGFDLVIRDISKITSIKIETVKNIVNNIKFIKETLGEDLVEKELLNNENFRKIKKKLVYDVAAARIQEFAEMIVFNNINLSTQKKKIKAIFLKINNNSHQNCFEDAYRQFFSENNNFKLKLIENITTENLIKNANKLVNYGWKKEAIPVTQMKKTLLASFFDAIFD